MIYVWVWRRLVARYLGVVEAAGSNPVTQTKRKRTTKAFCYALYFLVFLQKICSTTIIPQLAIDSFCVFSNGNGWRLFDI